MIDTRKADRRALKLDTIPSALREAERLAAAEREGRLRVNGNWSLGTALHHLGAWAEYPFDGYPAEVANPPWFVKVIAKMMKHRFARKPMPAGMRIPKIPGGTMATEPATTDAGLARMTRAFERLDREAPTRPNPILGPLAHEEWKGMNLRHAELHLGFFAVS